MSRTGRRPGGGSSREAIVQAAGRVFAAKGYDAVSVRAVAREAGVDPALVHRFYGSKAELFAAAMHLAHQGLARWGAALGDDAGSAGRELVRVFEREWHDPTAGGALRAMLQAAVTRPDVADMLRGYVGTELLGPVSRALDEPAAELRASLAAAQLVGLVIARHVMRLPPLADLPEDDVVAIAGDAVQRTLTGPLPAPG